MLREVMGLTISYQIKIRAQDTPTGLVDALALVKRSHRMAQRLRRDGGLKSVGPIRHDFAVLEWKPILKRRFDADCGWRRKMIYPQEGWLFMVDVGEGCETLELGLCRYPYTGAYLGPRRWRRWHSPENAVWQVAGFCKTQYASCHGWEHFRRCHLAVIKLLAFWQTLGAKVVIHDEGGYWPRGSERALARNLAEYDQGMAAFAGALQDTLAARGEQPAAPILSHPQFERLEAQGAERHGPVLEHAVHEVLRLSPRRTS